MYEAARPFPGARRGEGLVMFDVAQHREQTAVPLGGVGFDGLDGVLADPGWARSIPAVPPGRRRGSPPGEGRPGGPDLFPSEERHPADDHVGQAFAPEACSISRDWPWVRNSTAVSRGDRPAVAMSSATNRASSSASSARRGARGGYPRAMCAAFCRGAGCCWPPRRWRHSGWCACCGNSSRR